MPLEYIELVYDASIQLITAIDFAHNSKLIHGQLDLSKVKLNRKLPPCECEATAFKSPYENLEFEVTDFAPVSSMELLDTEEAHQWGFVKNQNKQFSETEKLEILMLKDIYAVGVCILEMMIGRFDRLKFNINIDHIPTEWGNLPESATLIKVLVECIQLDCITKRQGKLAELRKLLVQDFKKHFNKNYKMEVPFVGKRADVLNKQACVAYFSSARTDQATALWHKALQANNQHFYSCFNLGIKMFLHAEASAGTLIADFGDDVFCHSVKGAITEAVFKLAVGLRSEGLRIMTEYIESIDQKRLKRRGINSKTVLLLNKITALKLNVEADIDCRVYP